MAADEAVLNKIHKNTEPGAGQLEKHTVYNFLMDICTLYSRSANNPADPNRAAQYCSLRATGVRELAPYKVASYRNGAIICPSMAASWASATIISKNRGELKYIKIGLKGNR